MTEHAPQAIKDAFDRLDRERPDWHLALGGILGDRESHTYGYHRSRNWCARWSTWQPRPDYSISHADDQEGNGECASALDITPQGGNAQAVMRVMTARLIDAIDNRDPRARLIAEVYGTRNNTSVTGRLYGAPATSDDSHLWHVHVAGRRRFVEDADAWHHIIDVILGLPFRYPADSQKWSDTVTRDEVIKLIDERLRDGLQAVELGGDHGVWTEQFAPNLHVDNDRGDRDRLADLEARVEAIEAGS